MRQPIFCKLIGSPTFIYLPWKAGGSIDIQGWRPWFPKPTPCWKVMEPSKKLYMLIPLHTLTFRGGPEVSCFQTCWSLSVVKINWQRCPEYPIAESLIVDALWDYYKNVLSLPDSGALPCASGTRQSAQSTRQTLCRAQHTAKNARHSSRRWRPSLPCAIRQAHDKI